MANAILAKGSASISVNAHETEARLVFIPDPEGDGWDTAAIHKLAADNRLSISGDPKTLEVFKNFPLHLLYHSALDV